jgi:hypothetical protein
MINKDKGRIIFTLPKKQINLLVKLAKKLGISKSSLLSVMLYNNKDFIEKKLKSITKTTAIKINKHVEEEDMSDEDWDTFIKKFDDIK